MIFLSGTELVKHLCCPTIMSRKVELWTVLLTVIYRTAFWITLQLNIRQTLRHDDGTDGTYYFMSCFHSCSHRENSIREMKNLTQCCLQEHSIPFYRDGFIQGLGLELLKVLAKRITQIPRQMHLEQPFVQDNLQYSSQAILPYLPESCPLPSGYTAPGVLTSYIPTNICNPFCQSLILRSLDFV